MKFGKRLFAALLTLALVLSCFPMAAFAAGGGVVDYGTCGDNLTWVLTEDGTLNIYGEGSMWEYYDSPSPWKNHMAQVKAVVIESGITSIGNCAFDACSSLSSITIPDSVTSIGDSAFDGCSSLGSITIPDGVTSIGYRTFACCSSLSSITIPDGVTSIGDTAFIGCSSLGSITIPNSVTNIGGEAFLGCSSLTSVTIPNSVNVIGSGPFSYCTSLQEILVASGNRAYTSIDGVLYSRGMSTLIQYPVGKESSTFVISDDVTTIGDEAFKGCSSLGSITIPNGVTSIGDAAFSGCSSLSSITIPDSVTSIGHEAFLACSSLSSITIPAGVTSIGDWTFNGCSSLSSITIPAGVTSIGSLAFFGCSSLSSITIPNSVTNIGYAAFNRCSSLTDAYYGGTEAQWKSIAIDDENECLINATIHYNYCDHQYQEVVTPPTCTEQGYTTHTCTRCGDSYTDSYKDALGHKAELKNAKVATCTEHGYTGDQVCTVCGATIQAGLEIPALGHSWDGGVVTQEPTSTIPGTKTFTCTRCGETRTESIPATGPENPFVDVKEGRFYYGAVLWAVENKITSGMDATHFMPEQSCTRGQVVTFLWRAMGKPEPKGTANPFVDVNPKKFYYKAVLWAYENGITAGIDATHFKPEDTVTRGQFVTFLWRAEGKPSVSGSNPFTDVGQGRFYDKAVLWAAQNKITSGVTATTFAPESTCTRGQVVTFLYRDLAR